MAHLGFLQRSRIGKAVFILYSETLEVTTHRLGARNVQVFPLHTLSADYHRTAERFYSIIVIPLVLAGACMWLINVLLVADHPLAEGFLIYPFVGFFAFGWAALRGVPWVELLVFSNRGGHPVFYIAREKDQVDECDAFVDALLDHVEMIRQGVSPEDIREKKRRSESSVHLPGRSKGRVFGPTEGRWKLSLAAGVISSGFQPLVENTVTLHDWILPVVLFSTIAALLFGVLSFIAKERLRYLAVFGMALSLVAPIFS